MPTVKERKSQPKGWQFAKSLQFQLLSRTRSRIIEDLELWQLPPVQSRTYSLDEQSVQQDKEQCCSILQQNSAFESNSRLRLLILLLPVTTILVLTRSYHPGHEITAVFPGGVLYGSPVLQGSRLSSPSSQVVCLSGWLFTLWNLTLSSFSNRLWQNSQV